MRMQVNTKQMLMWNLYCEILAKGDTRTQSEEDWLFNISAIGGVGDWLETFEDQHTISDPEDMWEIDIA